MSTSLQEVLGAALESSPATNLCVAFSGGPDSTALLHALAQFHEARARGLRALHVDHGLHADSERWANHCREFCRSLDVPLACTRVVVDHTRGEGVEAAARHARRTAFARELRQGEWLALAHHRDDQIETVLLKLLRGAGPEGLGGMRALSPFAQGFLWRPLLETSRETLSNYLIQNSLQVVEDPSNRDRHFARNALRHEIVPRIERHWPNAGASILHAARLCRDAADQLRDEAATALAELCRDGTTLDAPGWLALPDALRGPVLDDWLRARHQGTPTDAQRRELERQAAHASQDTSPCVAWAGTEVRIWAGRLYAMSPLESLPQAWSAEWTGTPLRLPADCGSLELAALEPTSRHGTIPRLDPPLTVRLRSGGERIKPARDPHSRELRDLFQQARIPPWVRERCPLVIERDALIAVAGWWQSERGEALFAAHGVRPVWAGPYAQDLASDRPGRVRTTTSDAVGRAPH